MNSKTTILFHPQEWLIDPRVRVCSHEARGVLINLMCYLALDDDAVVNTLDDLAMLAGCDKAIVEELVSRKLLQNKNGWKVDL